MDISWEEEVKEELLIVKMKIDIHLQESFESGP